MILVNIAKFKEYRIKSGFSQNELGRRAGISEGTVSHIERTGRSREKTLKKIADVLKVELKELAIQDYPEPDKVKEERAHYIPNLTADEWRVIELLRETPEFTELVLKLLGGRKSVKEALEEFQKIPDPTTSE
jgi:transcriptional regulator with XRE-family HTH domain